MFTTDLRCRQFDSGCGITYMSHKVDFSVLVELTVRFRRFETCFDLRDKSNECD